MTVATRGKPQHMMALESANRTRLARAAIKRTVTAERETGRSRRRAAELILDPPAEMRTMRIFDLLTACHRTGRALALRQLLIAGIPERKAIGDLTSRQRDALAETIAPGSSRTGPKSLALAAAVASTLVDAGLRGNALAGWWRTGRSELGGLSPRNAIRDDQQRVLDLARGDAARLAQDLDGEAGAR